MKKSKLSSQVIIEQSNKLNKKTALIYLAMSIFSVLGFLTFLYVLKDIIIANAMSIKYVEQILWVIVGVLIFKEKITAGQVSGILISVTGILLIIINNIKAGGNLFIYLFPFIAAVCWTVSSNIGKYLVTNKLDLLKHMIYYYFFHISVLSVLLTISLIMNTNYASINIAVGSYEFLCHILSMTFFYKALRVCSISLIAPFVYIKLIISACFGYFLFHNEYKLWDLVSYSLIILGGMRILYTMKKPQVAILPDSTHMMKNVT